MCNTLIAQTQEIKINKQTVKTDTTNTIKKDSIKKEIVIKDNWSKTKTKVEKNQTTNIPEFQEQVIGSRRSDDYGYRRGVVKSIYKVKESLDTTIINFGKNKSKIFLDKKKHGRYDQRFRGHWTGIELGVASFRKNGSDDSNGFLELQYPKSTMVNINFIHGNIKLAGPKFGIVTGLGISWYNFTFKDDVTVINGKDAAGKPCTTQEKVSTTYPDMGTVNKTKLTMSYLTIPILLEFQANRRNTYISAGIIGGVRLDAHTKIKFSGGDKEKDTNDFYLLPYKIDATARIGFKFLTVWATYSLTELFQENKLYDNENKKYINKSPIALGVSINIF
jgi:hypothetical protein